MGIVSKLNYYIFSDVSPSFATKLIYFNSFKRNLNLKNPKTLNEKICWLKVYCYKDNELITKCADKYEVRSFVSKIDETILNEMYGVWNTAEEIDWDSLPNKFVLKANHGAGYNLICKDKKNFDKNKAIKQINKWLKHDFWKIGSELQYKNIKKKIIAEKFIETQNEELPNDYKIYCFHGEPKYIMSCEERVGDKAKFYYFNLEGDLIPFSEDSEYAIKNNVEIKLPKNYKKMLEISKKLSEGFKFVRVDLYSEFDEIIFGELTFSPGAGVDSGRLKDVDIYLGTLLNLEEV